MSTREASINRPSPVFSASIDAGTPRAAMLCLGAASIVVPFDGGEPQPVVGLGKPFAVLAYLILSPNRTASRERLADLLWGDQERAAARSSLRRALSYLRTRVGPWVIADGDENSCAASSALGADVLCFREFAEAGNYSAALELYRGDFLNDFASPGCREFESWASIERSHLRSLAARAAESWCRSCLERGQFAVARQAAARMKAIDVNSEVAWRLSVEASVSSGDRVGALAEVSRFIAWLESDGREPEAASRATIRLANASSALPSLPPSSPSALVADLVGREKQFAAVLEEWRHARTGSVRIVVLSGVAGLGKSRLLAAVANRIRARRERVVLLRAYPGEKGIPLAFAGAITHDVAQLPGAAGVPGSVLGQLVALDLRLGEQFSVRATAEELTAPIAARATALRELIAAVADDAPLALLLDDIHWCDDASLQLLAGVLSRLRNAPLLVVIATRLPSSGVSIEERGPTLPLTPFTEVDVDALISSLGTLPSGEEWPRFLVSRVTAASRGIPLLVLSALEQLVADETLILRDGTWSIGDRKLFRERVRNIDALATRLRALPPESFHLLLECSLAGLPLPSRVVSALLSANRATASRADDELERVGYIRRTDADVGVAHDAIAETIIALASPEQFAAASRSLGTALVAFDEAPWDEHGLRHLANAGDVESLRRPLTAVAERRMTTSRVTPVVVASVVLGRDASDPLVRKAVRLLPWRLRLRPFRRAAFFAIAAPVFIAGGFAARRFIAPAGPDSGFELIEAVGRQTQRSAQVPLDRLRWIEAEPIAAHFGRATPDSIPRARMGREFQPDQDAWAIEVQSPDSGGIDVELATRTGTTRRLTRSPSDEVPLAWSPDGRELLIATSQFSATKFKTLGIVDLASGVVRSIGATDRPVSEGAWSLDGTRILFATVALDSAKNQLCIMTVDAVRTSCVRGAGDRIRVVGWSSDSKALTWDMKTHLLYDVQTDSNALVPLGVESAFAPDLSPDGRWLAYHRLSSTGRQLLLAPSGNLQEARRVAPSAPLNEYSVIAWKGRFARREYLDSLAIDSPHDSIPLGAPYLLRVRGTSNLGEPIVVHGSEWKSLNTAVATVDSNGIVNPLREGRFTAELSAGGWRRARRTFIVFKDASRMLLDESWQSPFVDRWTRFGHPYPKIVRDSLLGLSFYNNGDGYYFSGAYMPHTLDASNGLAVDATVRLPITLPQGQYIDFSLVGTRGFADARRKWNHVTGYPSALFSQSHCGIVYPMGEGYKAALLLGGIGELSRKKGDHLPALGRGVPTHVRIQILPDGRCALAIDGERPSISKEPIGPLDSLSLLIEGNSVGTRLIVGRVMLRTGVPPGVNWASARQEH